jgi:hypothetical protein
LKKGSKKLTRAALTIMIVIGLSVVLLGYITMQRKELVEPVGSLWLKEDSILDPNSIRLAWGVRAPPGKNTDGWIFEILLEANDTIWLRSMWYETNQVFYESHGSALKTTVVINVDEKTSRMEWVWYLENPSSNTIMLHIMRVSYSGFRQPLRTTGVITIATGVIVCLVASSRLVQTRSAHNQITKDRTSTSFPENLRS